MPESRTGPEESRRPDGKRGNVLAQDGDLCRLVLESIEDCAITTLDSEGRFTGWSGGAERITGYRTEEVLGRHASLLFTPEDREEGEPGRELSKADEEGRVEDERWLVRKDGNRFWGSGVTTALRDESGRLVGFAKIVRDLTDQKEAEEAAHRFARGEAADTEAELARQRTEEALRRSEAKFSGIISAAADAIVSVDEDQKIIVFNHGAETAFGYSADEVLGQPLDILIPESVRDIHRQHVREFGESPVQSRHMGEPGQIYGRRKDGELFPMDASISKVEVDGEKIYTAVGRDVTQAVNAAQALRESNDTLSAVIRASPLALKVLDAEGRIEIWNPAAERIFGWTEEEVLGKELPTIPDELTEEADRIHEAAFRGETIAGVETYRLRKDGSRVYVKISTAPLHDARGQVRGTMVIIDDITERKQAEEALQETKERLEALVRSAPITVTALDLEGRVELWNPAAERIFGWTADEVYGRRIPLVPEDKQDELERELDAAARGEAIVGLETERVRKDGSRAAVRVSTAPLRNAAGEVRGMMSLVEDVSERERAEEEQRRLSAILEATPDFVGTTDPEGRFLYLNRAGRRMLGIEPGADISHLGPESIYPQPALSRILLEAIPTAIREGSWRGESRLKCSDGSEIPLSQVLLSHAGPDGGVAFLSTVARDITETKEREQALSFLAQASETLASTLEYEAALESLAHLAVPDLADFCVIDVIEDGAVRRVAVVHADPAKGDLVERFRESSSAVGRPVGIRAVIESGEPELVTHVTTAWIRAATGDETQEAIRDLNPQSLMIVPLVARGHTFGAITLVSTDAAQRYDEDDLVLAEELARRAALAVDNARLYRESQQATRIRDQVLRIVAHDLRNPLNTVGLSAGILLQTIPAEREQERRQLDIIRRSVGRANTLIQDLLDVAQAEAGTFAVQKEPVDTASLLEEILELHRTQAEEKGLQLEVEVTGELPPISADRDRVLQVFGNLIGNAIKFTDEGKVTVEAERVDDVVRFRVRDTGPGIPDEQLPHLFDPFWQARRAERAGAGLGLAISKGIIEAHGGEIDVDTEVGVGTTFSFTLPVAGADDEGAATPWREPPPGDTTPPADGRRSPGDSSR